MTGLTLSKQMYFVVCLYWSDTLRKRNWGFIVNEGIYLNHLFSVSFWVYFIPVLYHSYLILYIVYWCSDAVVTNKIRTHFLKNIFGHVFHPVRFPFCLWTNWGNGIIITLIQWCITWLSKRNRIPNKKETTFLFAVIIYSSMLKLCSIVTHTWVFYPSWSMYNDIHTILQFFTNPTA